MAPSYGCSLIASRLEHYEFNFSEIPGTHFIDLERMKG